MGVGILEWALGESIPPWFALAAGAASAALAAFSWMASDRYEWLVLCSKHPSPRRGTRFTVGERRVHSG
ncbi:MAG: hypothetical protein ACP5HT_00975 [Conexivisphaera sp.]|jgi:hypothetical protein